MQQKTLGKVLRVLRRFSLPAQIRIQGEPVCLAQFRQRSSRFLRFALSRQQHHTPQGLRKPATSAAVRSAWFYSLIPVPTHIFSSWFTTARPLRVCPPLSAWAEFFQL